MKRVLAMVMSMVLAVAVLAVPASAAQRKFYIPQKVTEYHRTPFNDGSVDESDHVTSTLSYDSKSKTLSVQNPDGNLPDSVIHFLVVNSTDSIPNQFVTHNFLWTGTPGSFVRLFSSDLIRFGKIARIQVKENNKTTWTYEFKTQNGKVKSYTVKGHIDDMECFDTENLEYNQYGNIQKIKDNFSRTTKGEQPWKYSLNGTVKYDSKNRIIGIDGKDNNGDFQYEFSNFSASGIPKKVNDGGDDYTLNVLFNQDNQISNITSTESGGWSVFGSNHTFYYDSNGYLTKIYGNYDGEEDFGIFSDFLKI